MWHLIQKQQLRFYSFNLFIYITRSHTLIFWYCFFGWGFGYFAGIERDLECWLYLISPFIGTMRIFYHIETVNNGTFFVRRHLFEMQMSRVIRLHSGVTIILRLKKKTENFGKNYLKTVDDSLTRLWNALHAGNCLGNGSRPSLLPADPVVIWTGAFGFVYGAS